MPSYPQLISAATILAAAASLTLVAVPAHAAKPTCLGRTATKVVTDIEDLSFSNGAYQLVGTTKSDVVLIDLDGADDHVTIRVTFDGVAKRSGGSDAVCATITAPQWYTTFEVVGGDQVSATGFEVVEATNPTSNPVEYNVNAARIDMELGNGGDTVYATSSPGYCDCQHIYIDGRGGDDFIYVDAGRSPTDAVVGAFGGSGNDSLYLHGVRANILGVGGPGTDAILTADANLLAYAGTPTYTGRAGGVTVRSQRTALNALLEGSIAELNAALGANPGSETNSNRLSGGSRGDILHGANGKDTIAGGGGNDRIRGNGGNDRLEGSFGNDRIEGGTGDDKIYGGDGDDWLRGNDDDDHVQGDAGKDDCSGGGGTDTLRSCNP